jgi:hypothetical protein
MLKAFSVTSQWSGLTRTYSRVVISGLTRTVSPWTFGQFGARPANESLLSMLPFQSYKTNQLGPFSKERLAKLKYVLIKIFVEFEV